MNKSSLSLRLRPWLLVAGLLTLFVASWESHAASSGLGVCTLASDAAARNEIGKLRAALTKLTRIQTVDSLRDADVALVLRGPGATSEREAAMLREFLNSGKGLVVIAAATDAWPSEPAFFSDVLGAMPKGRFAEGAAMTVINLFPHPIFTGVARFETSQPITLFEKLADDAQMIMEGTVGEATAPMAWVRRRGGSRVCHVVPGEAALFGDGAYQTIIANALLWSAGRPIPGAEAAVQRTFMPDAYPGAFAITLPNGPGVCLDPVRGGINYIWDGDFVDLRPRWLTKQGEAARILGEVFYREKEWQPLRAGAPGAASELRFRGYTLQDGYPEFHYEIGGREVHERITAAAEGSGIRRSFRVGAGAPPLWIALEPQGDASVTLQGLERDGNLATFPSRSAGEFSIEIRRKAVAAP